MKNNPLLLPFFFFLALAGFSCNTIYESKTLEYRSYRINDSLQKDAALVDFLNPYKKNVNTLMNSVIGYADKHMDRKLPESELGNFMADAFLHMAKEKFNMEVDAAVMNYGGIRLNQLPKGNVTTGSIFELMPFDNLLVVQQLKGSVLQEFIDLMAANRGWPVAGINFQIKDGKAINILIGGNPLNSERMYIIANSDYVANGGDNASMLKSIPQLSNGYLMREAIFDYIKFLKSQRKNISAKIENRVSNVE